jgi:hypothetical protein
VDGQNDGAEMDMVGEFVIGSVSASVHVGALISIAAEPPEELCKDRETDHTGSLPRRTETSPGSTHTASSVGRSNANSCSALCGYLCVRARVRSNSHFWQHCSQRAMGRDVHITQPCHGEGCGVEGMSRRRPWQ